MLPTHKIRKQILNTLNETILPSIRRQPIPQILVEPPFDFSGVEYWTLKEELLANKVSNSLEMVVQMEKGLLCSRRTALLGFCCSGASHERVGVTRAMAEELKQRGLPVPPGIVSFKLLAPGVIYVPSHVPHGGVSLRTEPEPHRILLIWFSETEIWLNLTEAVGNGMHNLSLSSPGLQLIRKSYADALRGRDYYTAQMHLLELMERLAEHLGDSPALISNSAWPSLESTCLLLAPHVSERNKRYCYTVIDYIQLHLQNHITLDVLAGTCGLTVPHLCSVFRYSTGMTLQDYLTLHRLRAAEMMLLQTSERIGDIARLTGFASSSSFSGAFHRRYGIGPRAYRQLRLAAVK
jgi:AraC-like DNA-binding protein